MTAIVGIYCQDGVVIGTDSSATFVQGAQRIIEQSTQKLYVSSSNVIVATTGFVGHAQRFRHICERAFDRPEITECHHLDVGKLLSAHTIRDFSSTGSNAECFGAIVGFPLNKGFYVCEFAEGDFQPEFLDERFWYVSMGGGKPITYPFLALMRDLFWQDGHPSLQDAKFAVTWTLSHAIDVNAGGINGPICMAVLERDGSQEQEFTARILDKSELDEHQKNIEDAKNELREYVKRQHQSDTAPEIPKP